MTVTFSFKTSATTADRWEWVDPPHIPRKGDSIYKDGWTRWVKTVTWIDSETVSIELVS